MDNAVRENTDVVAVKKEVGALPVCIDVISPETMELANNRLENDNAAMKKIHERLDDSKKRARQVWQDWNDLINELCEPFEKDKTYHQSQVKAYLRHVEEIRKAEEERLRQEALRLEEERRLKEAEELEKIGNHEEAQAVIEEPIFVVAPTVKIETPKVNMGQYRTNWRWRVTDFSKIPDKYKTTDDVKIGATVRTLKQEHGIPGIEVYPD
jgi:hypothetical protein